MDDRRAPDDQRARPRRLYRAGPLAAALVVAVVAGACGSGGSSASPGVAGGSSSSTAAGSIPKSGGSVLAQALRYADCMRSHGIADFPDPNSQGQFALNANGPNSDLNMTNPKFEAAQAACKSLAPGGATPAQQQQDYQAGLKYAHCMRSKGVDVPDPQPPGTGPSVHSNTSGSNSNAAGNIDPSSPQFIAANKACQHYLPAGSGPSLSDGGGS